MLVAVEGAVVGFEGRERVMVVPNTMRGGRFRGTKRGSTTDAADVSHGS